MEFRTRVNIRQAAYRIGYSDPVMFIGSCFASSMGNQMSIGKMPVMINPAGTVYNPVSVCNTLDTITSGRHFTPDDLYFHEGNWLSFCHYTDFSGSDRSQVLDNVNRRSEEAHEFLTKARYLFVTFGTARIFRLKETGMIVSNCHKIPAEKFERELLTVDEIVSLWSEQIEKLNSLYPGLRIIFTISPVRHWKDGAYGNQVSKSVLFLAVDRLMGNRFSPGYFPAYELLIDELRDYRFYDDDMLHPSAAAINFIWEAFCACYLEKDTIDAWNELARINKAYNHRIRQGSGESTRKFALKLTGQINAILSKYPDIDLSTELEYFKGLL